LEDSTHGELRSLDDRYEAATSELVDEWKQPAKQQLYTKPSARLLNMRAMLKGMIKAKRFVDVELLGKMIDAQERAESLDAWAKMQGDYQVADQRLADLYKVEKTGIAGLYDVRTSGLIRLREIDLRPILQRIDNLQRVREVAVANQKRVANLDQSGRPQSQLLPPLRVSAAKLPLFIQNPRLTVPPFIPKKKRPGLSASLPNTRQICRPKAVPTNPRV